MIEPGEYECNCGEPATSVTEDDIAYCDNCMIETVEN